VQTKRDTESSIIKVFLDTGLRRYDDCNGLAKLSKSDIRIPLHEFHSIYRKFTLKTYKVNIIIMLLIFSLLFFFGTGNERFYYLDRQ
jgi:hypothetical protein